MRLNTCILYNKSYTIAQEFFQNYAHRSDLSPIEKARCLEKPLESLLHWYLGYKTKLNSWWKLDFQDEYCVTLYIFTHGAEESGEVDYRKDSICISLYFDGDHFRNMSTFDAEDIARFSNLIAQMFVHETLHLLQANNKDLEQEPKAWAFDRPLANTGDDDIDYFSYPAEIQAYANNAAHQLLYAYGSRDIILDKLRTTAGIEEAISVSNTLHKYYKLLKHDPSPTWRRFLKETYYVIEVYTSEATGSI